MIKGSWYVRIVLFLVLLVVLYFGLIFLGLKLVKAPAHNQEFKGPTGEPFVKGPSGPPPGN